MITRLGFGCFVSIGGRPYLEDYVVSVPDFNAFISDAEPEDPRRSFFGVFDGHAGEMTAQYLAKRFHMELAQHPKIRSFPLIALKECWKEMDDRCFCELRRHARQGQIFPQDGSTATIMLVVGDHYYVTNCGDSSCYGFGSSTQLLTELHGTENENEIRRCSVAGGEFHPQYAMLPGRFPFCCFMGFREVGKRRVVPGSLLVTRAFGDFNAKYPELGHGGIRGVVIHDHGEVVEGEFSNSGFSYIVLGSDGLWDALPASTIGEVVAQWNLIKPTLKRSKNGGFLVGTRIVPITDSFSCPNIVGERFSSETDRDLVDLSAYLCSLAMASQYWISAGVSSDNTSCIVLRLSSS